MYHFNVFRFRWVKNVNIRFGLRNQKNDEDLDEVTQKYGLEYGIFKSLKSGNKVKPQVKYPIELQIHSTLIHSSRNFLPSMVQLISLLPSLLRSSHTLFVMLWWLMALMLELCSPK